MIEDFSVFFDDFAETITHSSVDIQALVDAPDELIDGDGYSVVSKQLKATCIRSESSQIKINDSITYLGTAYRVNDVRDVDDGKLRKIYFS